MTMTWHWLGFDIIQILHFADSIYTERYMGLPTNEDNAEGYRLSRLSTMATDFRGKNYYLVHGTLDDNVHYQQSMALARSLEQNDILFKQMVMNIGYLAMSEYK